MKYFFVFLVVVFTSCSQNDNVVNKNNNSILISKNIFPEFLIFGELYPDNYADDNDTVITKKFGFKIKRIAGCEINNNERIKAIKQNNFFLKVMNKKYGINWQVEFEKKTHFKLQIPFN